MRVASLAVIVAVPLLACSTATLAPPLPPGHQEIAPTLFAAGDDGVREVAVDGSVVRELSATPARWPRRSADGESLFFVTPQGELRRVALAGGDEQVVATLPAEVEVCGEAADVAGQHLALADLAVQSDDDFVVDAGGDALCLTLMDRNVNMMDVTVGVHVDLTTGTVVHSIDFPEACHVDGVPTCTPAAAAEPTAATADQLPYDLADSRLVTRGSDERAGSGGKLLGDGDGGSQGDSAYQAESYSPSRNWLLVASPVREGDYMHRSMYLLDRVAGALYPIRPGAWPMPIADGALADLSKIDTADSVGESTIRWLAGDILIIDHMVIQPGRQTVEIDGDLAP
jgi:hypothetical protein